MVTIKNAKKRIITFSIIVIAILLLFGVYKITSVIFSQNQRYFFEKIQEKNPVSLEELLKDQSDRQLLITLYYMPLDTLTVRPISSREFLNHYYEYRITVHTFYLDANFMQSNFYNLAKNFTPNNAITATEIYENSRLYLRFNNSRGESFTMELFLYAAQETENETNTVIRVNGEIYPFTDELSRAIIEMIIPYLPNTEAQKFS